MKVEYLSDSREVLIRRSVRRLENIPLHVEPALLSKLPSIRGLALKLNQSGARKPVSRVRL